MTKSEQKDICIRLYTEGDCTIKEIIEQAGLKYANELYGILDEAGIPRKRVMASERQEQQTIKIEDCRMRFLSGMCRLYNNEPENPYREEEDPFKRYMWRNEWKILQDAQDPKTIRQHDLDDPRNWSEYFLSKIRAYIKLWTNPKKGENTRQWKSRYYNFKK